MNLRVFEVLAHGGFLLTDALKPQAGLGSLFTDGTDLVTYDGPQDLLAKSRYYLSRPDLCATIARKGQQSLMERHHPMVRRRQLHDLVFGNQPDARYGAAADVRVGAWVADMSPILLEQRMRLYEYAQSLNRIATDLSALIFPSLHPAFAGDLADLSRMKTTLIAPTHWQQAAQTDTLLQQAGVAQQLMYRSYESALDPARPWGLVVLATADLQQESTLNALAAARWRWLIIADFAGDAAERAEISLKMQTLGAKAGDEADYPVWQRT